MGKKSKKSKLTDEQRQEKINNTIIKQEHFASETIYQKFLRSAIKHGYDNVNDFIKKEYFETNKTQIDIAKNVGCSNWGLSNALRKAGLANCKVYKSKINYKKRKYQKKIGKIERRTPNTIKQTEKWYICTNCGDKTRNRLLCDYCYTNADKEIEYDEHKVRIDY